MAVESSGGAVTITGPHIELFRLKAIRSSLSIEAKTGMRMSRGRKASVIAREILAGAKRPAPRKLDDLLTAFTAYVDAVTALTPPDADTLGTPS